MKEQLASWLVVALGVSPGANFKQVTGGLLPHSMVVSFIIYCMTNADKVVTFTTSLGFVGMMLVIVYILLWSVGRSAQPQEQTP